MTPGEAQPRRKGRNWLGSRPERQSLSAQQAAEPQASVQHVDRILDKSGPQSRRRTRPTLVHPLGEASRFWLIINRHLDDNHP